MRWNMWDKKNLFLKLKTKLGLYHVELRSKDSQEKITPTLVEIQQMPDIEKSWIKKRNFWFKNDNLQW